MNETFKTFLESIPAGVVVIIGLFAEFVRNSTNADANQRVLAERGVDAILDPHSHILASPRGRRACQGARSQAQAP